MHAAREPLLITIKEAMMLLGVSRHKIDELVKAGELDRVWLGPKTRRVTVDSINRLIRKGRKAGPRK